MLTVPGRSLVQAVVAAAVRDVASEGVGIVVGVRRADRSPTSLAGRCCLGPGLVLLDEHPAGIHAVVGFAWSKGASLASCRWDEPTSATWVRSGLAASRDHTACARTCLTAGGHATPGSASPASRDHTACARTCLTAGGHATAGSASLAASSAAPSKRQGLTASAIPSRARRGLPAPATPSTSAVQRTARILRATASTRGAAVWF